MVHKIINLIEYHSQESKGSKKLFSILATCSSFLSALKIIESYVMTSRAVVPSRYILMSSMKEIGKANPMGIVSGDTSPLVSSPSLSSKFPASEQSSPGVRLSIKPINRSKKLMELFQDDNGVIEKY